MAKTTGKKPSGAKVRPAKSPAKVADTKKNKVVARTIASSKAASVKPAATKTIVKKTVAAPKIAIKTSSVPAKAVKPATNGKAVLVRKLEPAKEAKSRIQPPAPPAVVAVPPAAMPENGKPRKNPAGFNARDLEHFRELLLVKRRELLGDLRSMEHEALNGGGTGNLSNLPIHMADMGTDNYEQEFTLGLVEKDRNILKEINSALQKIQGGTFGICEGTGKPINRERLEYQPWARFSIEHARRLERGGRPGRL